MAKWNEKLSAPTPTPGPKPVTPQGTVLKSEASMAATFMRSTHGLTSSPVNVARRETARNMAAVMRHARGTGKTG